MTCWLLSWCDDGLEAVVNLTQRKEQYVFDNLSEEKFINPIPSIIDAVQLRARFNPQRNYESYTIHIEDEMSEDDIRYYFQTEPLEFKKLIRQRANICIWS